MKRFSHQLYHVFDGNPQLTAMQAASLLSRHALGKKYNIRGLARSIRAGKWEAVIGKIFNTDPGETYLSEIHLPDKPTKFAKITTIKLRNGKYVFICYTAMNVPKAPSNRLGHIPIPLDAMFKGKKKYTHVLPT